MVQSILVLGGGSAGLIAALTLKTRIPTLRVEVVYSSRLGVIGVGEGTVPYVPAHFHQYLGLDEAEVFRALQPVFKLGIRFEWGPRPSFDYTFTGRQTVWRHHDLPRNNGFYAWERHEAVDLASALMDLHRAVPRRQDHLPDVPPPGHHLAWHIENRLFVAWLESACSRAGILFTDQELLSAETGPEGIRSILLADRSARTADLWIDSSGFASELLGKTLQTPFLDFSSSLFCDRAVVGGWDRDREPILPYTLSSTMNAGWMWRIDHPERIHRGYVFSSQHLSDDQAIAEYLHHVPQAASPRVIRFLSGHYESSWRHNVVAIGNAAGFVEPLEATALMVICLQSRWLTDGLIDSELRPSPSLVRLYNRLNLRVWTEIRDFLALHYRFNDRLSTPFWQRCRHETPLHSVSDLVGFYQENGPSAIASNLLHSENPFGLEGHFTLLTGLRVPHQRLHHPSPEEQRIWQSHCDHHRRLAANGLDMRQLLIRLKDPQVWKRIRRKVA